MIESAPKLTQEDYLRLFLNNGYRKDSDVNILIDKANEKIIAAIWVKGWWFGPEWQQCS